MNAELLSFLDYWEREKGLGRDVLILALQEALSAGARKADCPARKLRCTVNSKTGDIKAFATLIVSDKILSRHDQISLAEARRHKADAQIGEELEVEVTTNLFGRIAALVVKQNLMQCLRREEKKMIFDEFKDRLGEIVSGTVRRFERSDVTIDLGRYEAVLPNRERVPNENYEVGERILCYVKAVDNTTHGPDIILSRSDPQFVVKLFKREVSEINDGTIEIKAIARDAGFRTKLAVYTRDEKVDPVGACVGLRGQRVKNIVRELNNEKVDIIPWHPNIEVFIANALAPAKYKSIEVDHAARRAKVWVAEDQLSLAIGRRGQNARLTSKLTGWQVDIDVETTAQDGFAAKVEQAVEALAAIPGITREQADALVHLGFLGLEDLASASLEDLQEDATIGAQAAAILEAAKAEAGRRQIKL